MLRRSAHKSGPRKTYTVDAFAGIEELQAVDEDAADAAHDDSADEFQTVPGQEMEDDDDDEPVSDDEADDLASEAANDGDLNDIEDDIEATPPPLSGKHTASDPAPTYTRGLRETIINGNASKPGRRRLWCGPSPIDYEPLERAVEKWGSASPLPQRHIDSKGRGGFALSFYRQNDPEDDGRSAFLLSPPDHSLLNPDQCRPYINQKVFHRARFLLGHHRQAQLFRAEPGQAVSLSNSKPGFILNVGARIECLEWVPKHGTSDQYLTVSLSPAQGSAFQARPGYKSMVQTWHIRTDNHTATLRQVLCTDWGDAIWLKWSHCGASEQALGLLASIWTDGPLRVLHIPRPQNSQTISYQRLSKPVVEYRAPNTVFTCVTWLSKYRIAAGCANGCIAVFDIDSGKTRPAIYRPVADTYIVNISSCAPSRPHLVLVTTPGGRVTVTDLSQPQMAGQSASSQRVRTGASQFVWSDHSQCVVSTDDARGIHALPLRKLSYMKGIGSSKAVTTAIAGSPCHPYVLVGGVGGEVTCLNPLQRVLIGRKGLYQQIWFQHEWRRPRGDETEPLSRFVEGFKLDEVRLAQDDNRVKGEAEIPEIIVQEEETAVSALSWNPNLHAGGWAAAAMTCGLIRVEDIAV